MFTSQLTSVLLYCVQPTRSASSWRRELTNSPDNLTKPWSYLAILKGRRGEYAALRDLDATTRPQVVPLIQLWSRQGDEVAVAEMTLALKDMRTGWGAEPAVLLDGAWMKSAGGFWRSLEAAHALGRPAVPVTGLDRPDDYRDVTAQAVAQWGDGVALRLHREDFIGNQVETRLTMLLSDLHLDPAQVDVILDLRDVLEAHQAADETAAIGMLTQLPWATEWRHLALAATAIPAGVRGFPPCAITPTPRAEWWIWQGLWERRSQLPRMPTFADYAIAHPDPVEDLGDHKFRRVSAHLRYTITSDWLIVKSLPVSDGGTDRLPGLFKTLIQRTEYESPDFSSADRWIDEVSRGAVSPGNTTTWRHQGTVRHLTFVARQLSSFGAA
jgi:hypothetical protein